VAPVTGHWAPAYAPPPWPSERFDPVVFAEIAPLVQERVATLGEVPAMVDFLFLADPPEDLPSWEKAVGRDEGASGILTAALAAFGDCAWTSEGIREATVMVGEAAGRKLAKAQAPIRVAVTGRTVGPPLFESLKILGRSEVLRRLEAAVARAGVAADPG
jgi:glutamyl-tRNA synthetase